MNKRQAQICDFKCNVCKIPPPCPRSGGNYEDTTNPREDPTSAGYFDEAFETEFHHEEFEAWRDNHPRLTRKEPAGNVHCCPRCRSTNIEIGETWIFCHHCNYNEPRADYPANLSPLFSPCFMDSRTR